MDPVAFGVYTEFFTHVQSICYFLQNEAWQQRAQSTALRLTSASEDVARQLASTNQLAEETARVQNATLLSQERILQDGELLRQTLQDSSQGVRQAFRDLQDSAGEQRVVFAEIFNHVAFLHRFVVGKSSAVYSVLFHLLSVAAVLVLTSSQRTSGARCILLALVGASIYLESTICSLLMDNSEGGYDLMEESLSFWVGLSRWGFAVVGLAVAAYCIWSYKDPIRQSQEVLQSLRETQVEFQRLLQETERLLAERDLLLHGSEPRATSKASSDSGVPEQLSSLESKAEKTEGRVGRPQVAKVWASALKRRRHSLPHAARSPSRQQSQMCSEALAIPVPLEEVRQYNLRRHPAIPRPPSHV
ncbi:uncharacterized protein LOC129346619 isoform X2 [Eublepharis macularius]|nr:uncharacterized protein LOC129346619 isoform X2 [Eublepharis macularius]XP_054859944.1 uncharacterized protein LOC129346619 isoform X2 [Eublepharis macularius]